MLHPRHSGQQQGLGALLRRLTLPALAATALPGLIACGTPQSPQEAMPSSDANVVLIVIDTLGAENVGAYNPALSHTPNIDAFAGASTRFSRAYSTAPWTQPSVASIFTGLLPSAHGVHNIRDVLPPEQETLAERLKARGYATTGIVSHHLIGAKLGYDQGFDRYDESAVGGHTGLSSEAVTDAAIQSIDSFTSVSDADGAPSPRPFFLFAHYFDPHWVFHAHPDYDRSSSYQGPLRDVDDVWAVREMRPRLQPEDIAFLRDRHLEEVAFVDQHVGRLLNHIDQSGLGDDTIVVLVSDHGEEFLEHGWFGHTRTLYDELIHVPLAMRIPGVTPPGVVDSPVSTTDLTPTVLAALGLAQPSVDGQSLLPFLTGQQAWPAERGIVSEVSFLPPSTRQQEKMAFKTSLVRGDLKLIHDRKHSTWELYRLSADPGETNNLATAEPDAFKRMSRELLAWEETRDLPTEFTMAPPDGISAEELERLRALGYVN